MVTDDVGIDLASLKVKLFYFSTFYKELLCSFISLL